MVNSNDNGKNYNNDYKVIIGRRKGRRRNNNKNKKDQDRKEQN